MHRCLRIPEVVREICGLLQRKGALSMALTCRQFLEPGLDKVWVDIASFNPLIACMPEDLWKVEERVERVIFKKPTRIYSLSRALRPSDIERYLRFYARRIRIFSINGFSGDKWIAIDALQALQVMTNCEPGALSPQLREIGWEAPDDIGSLIGDDWANNFLPCMSLFWGPSLSCLRIAFEPGYAHPLYATINQATALTTRLKQLYVIAEGDEQRLLDQYLRSFPWPHLEYLRACSISPSTLLYLATLPCLNSLELTDVRGLPLPLVYSETTDSATITSEGRFSNLKTLDLESDELQQITALLQHVAPTSPLQVLACVSLNYVLPHDARNAIESVRLHANPNTLRSLLLRDGYGEFLGSGLPVEEPIDLDPDASIDITSLLAFRHLTSVQVLFKETVLVTPELISHIPLAWPGLTLLELCPQIPSTRMPLVDHTHFLDLLRGCKSLLYLGLRFDATKIRGAEVDRGAPFALRGLRVGDSPILSPSRVLSFFESNVPGLARPVRYVTDGGLKSVYEERWEKLVESRAETWKEDLDAPWSYYYTSE